MQLPLQQLPTAKPFLAPIPSLSLPRGDQLLLLKFRATQKMRRLDSKAQKVTGTPWLVGELLPSTQIKIELEVQRGAQLLVSPMATGGQGNLLCQEISGWQEDLTPLS